VAALLGGRAAEEVVFGEPSTGAADDLVRATEIARRMVWEFGMSEVLGPLAVEAAGPASDGRSGPSAQLLAAADAEVRSVLDEAAASARAAVEANLPSLRLLAEELLEAESLEGEALQQTLDGVRPAWDGAAHVPGACQSAAA
jgi:cell division protease FtsH